MPNVPSDPNGWWAAHKDGWSINDGIKKVGNWIGGIADESQSAIDQRQRLNEQGARAGGFANTGEFGYNEMGAEAAARRQHLERLASGQDSIAKEQLRQGLAQNMAQQRSMAASASPANAAMAARQASMNMGRATSGMAGQAVTAQLAERQAAEKALADMILRQREQDMNVALGSRRTAVDAYGNVKPEGSTLDKWGGAITGAATVATKSDERLKRDIKDGDSAANRVIDGLKSYRFKYKDEKYGKGERLGIMAQGIERAGLKHAVIDEPDGKAIHAGHLSTANTAMIGAHGRRLSKLEGKGK